MIMMMMNVMMMAITKKVSAQWDQTVMWNIETFKLADFLGGKVIV